MNAAVMPSRPMLMGRSVPIAKMATSTMMETISLPIEYLPEDLDRVACAPSGPVRDLLPAGHAGRGDHGVRGLLADRGEQAHPADAHGQLVVLLLEAEGPGHSAAPGVELDDLGARDLLEQPDGGRRARERLLMAVAVEEDAPGSCAQRQAGVEQQLFDQAHARGDARLAEQLDVLLAQRQQARWLAARDQGT